MRQNRKFLQAGSSAAGKAAAIYRRLGDAGRALQDQI
jgi:hypothetical protein